MATITLGTNATTSLTPSIKFLPGWNSGISAADMATVARAIKDDKGNAHSIVPGAFNAAGQLFIPNRGVLTVLPGDYIGVDSTGWPILVSAYAIANGPWTHS